MSKYFYNDSGKLEFQIDYKHHNMGGPYVHQMSPPGDIRIGHYPEAHVPFMLIPKKYW